MFPWLLVTSSGQRRETRKTCAGRRQRVTVRRGRVTGTFFRHWGTLREIWARGCGHQASAEPLGVRSSDKNQPASLRGRQGRVGRTGPCPGYCSSLLWFLVQAELKEGAPACAAQTLAGSQAGLHPTWQPPCLHVSNGAALETLFRGPFIEHDTY